MAKKYCPIEHGECNPECRFYDAGDCKVLAALEMQPMIFSALSSIQDDVDSIRSSVT